LNDIDRGNSSFVYQSSLAIIAAELSNSKVGGIGEENDAFGLAKYLFHTRRDL
jgi:hypothetical protein